MYLEYVQGLPVSVGVTPGTRWVSPTLVYDSNSARVSGHACFAYGSRLLG